MDDAALVSSFERFGNLLGDRQCVPDGQRTIGEPLRQRRALDEL